MKMIVYNSSCLLWTWHVVANFYIHPDVVLKGGKVVPIENFLRGRVKHNTHVLVFRYRSTIVKSLIFWIINMAPGVHMVISKRIYFFVILVHWVVVIPCKCSRSPIMLRHKRYSSSFFGRI